MGAIHPDESLHRANHLLTVITVFSTSGRGLQDDAGKSAACIVLTIEYVDQIGQFVGSSEARKQLSLFRSLVKVLDEIPYHLRTIKQHEIVEVLIGGELG